MKKFFIRTATVTMAALFALGLSSFSENSLAENPMITTVYAATIVSQGNCSATTNDSVNYTLDSDGTLTISGTGAMKKIPQTSLDKSLVKKVVIEDGVTSIAYSAFSDYTSLTSVTIRGSLSKIPYQCFYGCSSLKEITFPNTLTTINSGSFSGCGLETITLPDSLTNLQGTAFSNNPNLKSVVLPEGISTIPGQTFLNCPKLESINIPASVTSIGQNAFGFANISATNTTQLNMSFESDYSKDLFTQNWCNYANILITVPEEYYINWLTEETLGDLSRVSTRSTVKIKRAPSANIVRATTDENYLYTYGSKEGTDLDKMYVIYVYTGPIDDTVNCIKIYDKTGKEITKTAIDTVYKGIKFPDGSILDRETYNGGIYKDNYFVAIRMSRVGLMDDSNNTKKLFAPDTSKFSFTPVKE